MVGLSNAMDRRFFKINDENGKPMGDVFWWNIVLGFITGAIIIGPRIFSKSDEMPPFGIILTNITSVVALVLIVIYGYKTILLLKSMPARIVRGIYIFIWGMIGYGLGYGLGAIIVAAIIVLVILWIVLKMFLQTAFEGGGSSSNSSSSNKRERIKLNDGTEVEETSTWGKYKDVNGWETYTRDGDKITKD